MSDVTPEQLALTKAWAASQYPPVRVLDFGLIMNVGAVFENWPVWLAGKIYQSDSNGEESGYESEDEAWRVLAGILAPVFASVRPVIAAAERERCAEIAESIDSGRGNEKEIANAIRGLQ
jgi:hypothetical protein